MRVLIGLPEGGSINILSMEDRGVLELVENWQLGDSATIAVGLDDDSVMHIARRHILFIEIMPETEEVDDEQRSDGAEVS